MGTADFSDGDAMAAAMSALTDAERAKAREAAEKKAKRRVILTAGDINEIVRCLSEDTEFAQRFTGQKEHGVRTASVNIVARNRPLIDRLRKKIPEYVTELEGR